jgi:hypothetical protein
MPEAQDVADDRLKADGGHDVKYRMSMEARQILERLLQMPKVNNQEIAWVMGLDQRTVRRRRAQFLKTGTLTTARPVSKNAEKIKPEYFQVWHTPILIVRVSAELSYYEIETPGLAQRA